MFRLAHPRPGAALLSACLLLGGCAHYTTLPLATQPPLAPAPSIATPLSVADVTALALADNPDLVAARAKRGVAKAQVKQAGILPNPQVSGAFLPLLAGAGSVPAWSLGLSQNIRALLTYRPVQRGAQDSARQVAADVVWQEWQVAGKARQLAAGLMLAQASRPSLAAALELLRARCARLDAALAAGNVTLATAAPDRAATDSARTALDTLDQKILTMHHQLAALLGLVPDAPLPLAPTPDLPPFDPAAIAAMVPGLADRRPDLLALRLGYAAADEQVRAAILAQFPDLVLGGGVNSDNARVINGGPNVQLGLPLFDRNQGNVAIARATRAQLHAEYAARLAAATGEVAALLGEYRQLEAQLATARRTLPAAQDAARHAEAAFGRNLLDERSFVDLLTARLAREQDIMTLEQQLLDRRIAIQTLVGDGLPAIPPSLPAPEATR